MSFSFNSQIKKLNNKADTTEYSIQITTDNKEQYLFMQEMARQCVDGMHKEINNEDYFKELQDTLKKYSYIGPEQLSSDSTSVYIPKCCRNCPNHPSNGGSGICNCAAPAMKQDYYTYTNTITTSNNIIGDQK
jgi:hypothetical protein